MKQKRKKTLLLVIKICISLSLFYFVFKKINVDNVLDLVASSNPGYLLLATACFVLSQITSSFRLNYLFNYSTFQLSETSNLKLYLLGMFYNFFVPGGVGGDAYKVYLLNTNFKWPTKKVLKIVFIDRLIGLIAIATILYTIIVIWPGLLGNVLKKYNIVFLLAFPALIVLGQQLIAKIFQISSKSYYTALIYSVGIQSLQIARYYVL